MLMKENEEECFNFACKHFALAYAGEEPPRLFMIERNASLRAAIMKVFV
jgi:hypothetical protein